jgi:protein-S-isoprenylcysteine O-methyltransferase Ste14
MQARTRAAIAHFVVAEAFMTNEQTGTGESPDRGPHWPAAAASLAVGAAFFAFWFWVLPPWLGFHVDAAGAARWRCLAAVPSVFGFAVALRCVWDFGWTGHGTPAPVAPPKKLVVVGFYRYVRNPMYLGFYAGWIGLWVVFGRASLLAIAVACLAVLGTTLFVALYEEPTLGKMFGEDYAEYRRNVPRWIPRMRAWHKR